MLTRKGVSIQPYMTEPASEPERVENEDSESAEPQI